MKKIFALVFFSLIINVIVSINICFEGSWIFKTITLKELTEEYDIVHKFRFYRTLTSTNNFMIEYFIFPELSNYSTLNGTVQFCETDVSTLPGTIATIAATVLGVDIVDGTPCPVDEGLITLQWSNLTMDEYNLDSLFNDNVSLIQVIMTVPEEDWGLTVDIYTDERAKTYPKCFNRTADQKLIKN